jgi:hypothetical protein
VTINAYPLQWPEGWKRTLAHFRSRAKFSKKEQAWNENIKQYTSRTKDVTVMGGIERVLGELSRMDVHREDCVISTNLRTRLDGLPRSDQREPDDPGVAVYWVENDGGVKDLRRVMAIDRYDRVADNLAAIAATLDAMRAIERHGGAAILERAFTGFTALPNPTNRQWRDVLGKDITTAEQLESVYKRLRSDAHPDRGGNGERFHEVQQAYEAARQELRA